MSDAVSSKAHPHELLTAQGRTIALGLAAVGLVGLAAGIAVDPVRGWTSLLTAGFLAVACSLGGLAWMALFKVANAGFWVVFKRVLESMAGALVVGGAAMLALLGGVTKVYKWAAPAAAHDAIIQAKGAYLTVPAFGLRMVAMLGVWLLFAYFIRRASLQQDADGDVKHTRTAVAWSAVFLLVGGYSLSLAGVDWLMSTDPHWASNIWGYYTIGIVLLSGVAATVLVTARLRHTGALVQMRYGHIHDLGKLLFGFSTFWAYLWFSQFLLIWYANLPEETGWINTRLHGGWAPFWWANIIISWVLPFLLLLPQNAKKSGAYLTRIAVVVLIGRWLDIWLAVAPSNMPVRPIPSWIELSGILLLGGAWVWAVDRGLKSAPLLAKHDPYMEEALHHHT